MWHHRHQADGDAPRLLRAASCGSFHGAQSCLQHGRQPADLRQRGISLDVPDRKGMCPIRAELERVLTRKDELPAFHELATDVSTISRDHGWKSFILAAYGFRSANNIGLCPQTWRICQNIPGLISVMYSIMEPPPWSLKRSAAASSRSDCSGATRHARHPGRKRSVPVAQGRGRHFR